MTNYFHKKWKKYCAIRKANDELFPQIKVNLYQERSLTTLTNEKRRIADINNTTPIKTVPAAINVRLVFNLPTSE